MKFSDEYISMVQSFLRFQDLLIREDLSDNAKADACRQMVVELQLLRSELLMMLPAVKDPTQDVEDLRPDYNPADVINQG